MYSLVIFNNTRVVHARILFNRETGAQIEVFCIEPQHHLDYQQAFISKQNSTWKCMVGNAKKWKEDFLEKKVETPLGDVILKATKKATLRLKSVYRHFMSDDGYYTLIDNRH